MSSLRNAIPRKAHKERAQPNARKKFGILEKHKDYVQRAKVFHQKEETLRKLEEKAALKHPDEFYFKMINSKTVDGIHVPKDGTKKYTKDEVMVMKTQDIAFVLQKLQSERKKYEKLRSCLHMLDERPQNKHFYFADDSDEEEEIVAQLERATEESSSKSLPSGIKRQIDSSYKELEARKSRIQQLERLYEDLSLQKELQKPGQKRKLRSSELTHPTTRPVYKWRTERKR